MQSATPRTRSDVPFLVALSVLGGVYVLLIVGMLLADVVHVAADIGREQRSPPNVNGPCNEYAIKLARISGMLLVDISAPHNPLEALRNPEYAIKVSQICGLLLADVVRAGDMHVVREIVREDPVDLNTPTNLLEVLRSPRIRYAIKLSLISCTISAILSVWVAVPLGYLMSRFEFRGKAVLDAILDIPIVLPPVVIGISLLILFSMPAGQFVQQYVPVTYTIAAVIIAQFAAAAAFAVRTMQVTFDQISPRQEQVAMTLGCSRGQAFWLVILPQARRGIVTAGTVAWARSMGEFGPVMMFAGTTKFATEVLPSSVFLEFSKANLRGAVAISLLMVVAAVIVLLVVRVYGTDVRGKPR